METRIELTVDEKLELAMEDWKKALLSMECGDEQARAAEKDRLIQLALGAREHQLTD